MVFHQCLFGIYKEEVPGGWKAIRSLQFRNGKQTVNYESPVAYGLTILYVLQTGDTKFAKELYDHMATFRNDNVFSRYYGGYVTGENNNTHIFDNVLPLLAEMELKSEQKVPPYEGGTFYLFI